MVQIPKFDVYRINVDKKTSKVCCRVLLSKNFQQHICSTVNCLSNSISILAVDDPVTIKNLDLKALTPNRKDVHFTFYMLRTVQSAIADLLVVYCVLVLHVGLLSSMFNFSCCLVL